jgi:hypothetical protein
VCPSCSPKGRTGADGRGAQIFDNASAVEYWENFALHAFENTTRSVVGRCTLTKPDGARVPCAFCFSIRKDIFDLPSLIIGACRRVSVEVNGEADWVAGQWLPLL